MNVFDRKSNNKGQDEEKSVPSRQDAEEAVRVLIKWAGDDPLREGLKETPKRVVKAYEEWFRGYSEDPKEFLERTFDEVNGYSDTVILKDIPFESYCEHHIAPIIGKAHVGYLPTNRVVGISKLVRLVDTFAKRLQVQEKLTEQIAKTLQEVLQPEGVAVVVEGEHHCMCTRGVHKVGASMITSAYTQEFKCNRALKEDFLRAVLSKNN